MATLRDKIYGSQLFSRLRLGIFGLEIIARVLDVDLSLTLIYNRLI